MNSIQYPFSPSATPKNVWLTICLLLNSLLYGQQAPAQGVLTIGDEAPRLYVREWMQGQPIDSLQRGRLYVIEFWATWCQPCIKAMPLMGRMAKKYQKSVTFLSVNTWENKKVPRARASAIVDSMGRKVKYPMAFDDSGRTAAAWLDRTWNSGVPQVYVVNREGRIAWIGHPLSLDTVLGKVIKGTWDEASAASNRNFEYEISLQDEALREDVMRFFRTGNYSDFVGEPDSTLYYIDSITAVHPALKYAYHVTYHKFIALIKTDMNRALTFANEAIRPDNPLGPEYWAIIQGIKYMSSYLGLSPEIYAMGGGLMEKYGGTIAANLIKASEWYWLGGKKEEAMRCMKKGRKAVRKATNNRYGAFF